MCQPSRTRHSASNNRCPSLANCHVIEAYKILLLETLLYRKFHQMSSVIVVPQGFSYVAGALLSTVFLVTGQSAVVSTQRKAAGIKYPQMYAEQKEVEASVEALKFNCAQRAHQNTLENLPIIYTTTLVAALKFPKVAAAACAFWSLTRVLYTRGYLSGDPARRNKNGGSLYNLAVLVLLGTSIYTAGSLMLAGI
ncbi:hypothetical protein HHX47_DHR1001084 [Lentinula edodes]|nr:hypothetical protein HHX47_DHR1001084 [Lentinula edodes]